MNIDMNKKIYIFLHGRSDFKQKSIDILTKQGFNKDKMIIATRNEIGDTGDYMAMLWPPMSPDSIKIQQITDIKKDESDNTIGLWKGVSSVEVSVLFL